MEWPARLPPVGGGGVSVLGSNLWGGERNSVGMRISYE